MEGYKRDGEERGRVRESGIPEYRCRHTGARGCNALLMNTKNFIKDCLYIKLSTKLCPITPVAPSRAWKLLAAAMVLPFPSPAWHRRPAGQAKATIAAVKSDRVPTPRGYRSRSLRVFFPGLIHDSADNARDIHRPSKSVISRPLGHTLLGGTI